MKIFDTEALQNMAKVPRLNLVNSITGYKSANLIGTVSNTGVTNVAIFSSITHLGSNPALLGFMIRPVVTTPRDTYKNIKENLYFTVNHITSSMITDAHHTSAPYAEEVSEFDKTHLEPEFLDNQKVPFVKNSPVKLLCKYLNEYPIIENGCIHIVASIEKIYVDEHLVQDDYWVRLDLADVVTINGLDGYCVPKLVNRFEYARTNQPSKSML